jgi:hypothetical protein
MSSREAATTTARTAEEVRIPNRPEGAPAVEYLEWHTSNVFKG